MSERGDIDALAAEYVLGTLDLAERIAVDARRQREPLLDAAIAAWERRLVPLALSTPAVAPPSELYRKIMARLDARTGGAEQGAEILQLSKRLQRWRIAALATGAVAASLLILVGVTSFKSVETPQRFVAVLQQSDTSPAFLVAVDLKTRELSVRAVAAQAQPGRSYELWLVNDQLGAPRSLGVVDTKSMSVRPALARYDANVVRNSTYAISLEPEGGSPTGAPTGPVLYTGRLLEVAQ